MNSSAVSLVLSYTEAAASVHEQGRQILQQRRATEDVPLLASAGRVLAKPVVADRDQPPFPRSTRDGFACRAHDLQLDALDVVGQIRAGQSWSGARIGAGEAVEIMTGAPLPPGSDCVVMVEHVAFADDRIRLSVPRSMARGDNVVAAGAEARAGDELVPAGCRLGVPEIASAAACGYATVPVFTRPRVAILATGDELVGVDEKPLPHQIRNSNSYSLAAQVSAAGGDAVLFPTVPDDRAATRQAIAEAASCDLVLLTGGVSMGKFDFVERALPELGARFFFTGARIQPGKPVVFGKLPGPYFFGLPGNPISTMVTFLLFSGPLLRALSGESEFVPRFAMARLEGEVHLAPGLTRFLPARITSEAFGSHIRRIPWHGSGDLAAAAQANAFLVGPETAPHLPAGAFVSALLI